MDDPRRQRFMHYIRELADRMDLKDWEVVIADNEASDSTCAASVGFVFGKKFAKVWLNPEFLDETPEKQREYLVHELVHPHFEDAWEIATDSLPDAAKPGFRRMMEHGINGVARAWAPLLPVMLRMADAAKVEPEPAPEPDAVAPVRKATPKRRRKAPAR